MHTCDKLFTKTPSLNLALSLQAHFLECRLTPFGKALFICTYMYVLGNSLGDYKYLTWVLNLCELEGCIKME